MTKITAEQFHNSILGKSYERQLDEGFEAYRNLDPNHNSVTEYLYQRIKRLEDQMAKDQLEHIELYHG